MVRQNEPVIAGELGRTHEGDEVIVEKGDLDVCARAPGMRDEQMLTGLNGLSVLQDWALGRRSLPFPSHLEDETDVVSGLGRPNPGLLLSEAEAGNRYSDEHEGQRAPKETRPPRAGRTRPSRKPHDVSFLCI